MGELLSDHLVSCWALTGCDEMRERPCISYNQAQKEVCPGFPALPWLDEAWAPQFLSLALLRPIRISQRDRAPFAHKLAQAGFTFWHLILSPSSLIGSVY